MKTYWPLSHANRLYRSIEHMANRRGLACLVAALVPVAIRLAFLPFPAFAIPAPAVSDEVSYLLAADTFASGRLTNPTHPMWMHFETFHENMQPSYMSKYPPGQGLFLALGKVLFRRYWYGVLISFGLMCACLCWMFQGWMPPVYAFLGTMLAVAQIGILDYWMNSYWGGAVAAAGGSLVLGALPRLAGAPRVRAAVLGAVGVLLLVNSRPYEGLVMTAACGIVLLWQRARRGRPIRELLSPRCALPFALICCAGGVWMGYYNYRVTGSPLTLPYSVNNKTYGLPPALFFLPPPTPVTYHHEAMRRSYQYRIESYKKLRAQPFRKLIVVPAIFPFYCSMLSFFAIGTAAIVCRSVKLWSALGIWIIVWMAFLLESYYNAHYLAGATGLVFISVMYGARLLRVYARAFGKPLVLLFVTIPFTVGLIYGTLGGHQPDLERRRTVENRLLAMGGRHLVMVRYSPDRSVYRPEWVFNAADIDASPVVWAKEMGQAEDRKLLDYYRDRTVWLFEPDSSLELHPYTVR